MAEMSPDRRTNKFIPGMRCIKWAIPMGWGWWGMPPGNTGEGTVPIYTVDPDSDFDKGRERCQSFYVDGLTETGFCEI